MSEQASGKEGEKPKTKGKYLNRQSYLDAALDIVAEGGVDKLSMRKVADRLGVSAMATYKHFSNKEELLMCVLDEFITRADVIPDNDLPWDQWVEQLGKKMYEALSGESSWVPLLGSINIGPNALHVTASFIVKLTEEGFPLPDAIESYLTMIHIVIGAVSIQSSLIRGMDLTSDTLAPLTEQFVENMSHGDDEMAEVLEKIVRKSQIEVSLPMAIQSMRARLEAISK